jgi:GTPase SAR1 family protein
LQRLCVYNSPLNPELAAAEIQGVDGVKAYLRARSEGEVTLNEAKLILVGEGEVGKSCLLGALRGDGWVEGRPTTHGIEIKPVVVTETNGTEITLNGWDFGGQRVYRPTHQLFFSAPAVYLVVWKPREGPQQGFVREWITLIKHREPDAKILVVATHGGPTQRQPDIDRQELIDCFGEDTVLDFFFIDSKPSETGECRGINALKQKMTTVAAALPGMGRTIPAKWHQVREALRATGQAYISYTDAIAICEKQGVTGFLAELCIRVYHTLGNIVHYHYDPLLKDIVILKPDWLAKAISFVLDDQKTRDNNGLVSCEHLSQIWSHPPFENESGYPKELHPIFLRLMERFDLSYKVVLDTQSQAESNTSLIAQLVQDNRPQKLSQVWGSEIAAGETQQIQICRIVDERGQLATAEGLFYQLIVRLHKYSLGRNNYADSVHWQRGLVLDDDYNGLALLEHTNTNIQITVRAAYPEFFLHQLTREVKSLVDNFWEGLRCEIVVPCIEPCGKNQPGLGQFEVQKLIESKKKGRPEYPCNISGCDEWQNIDQLMRNASTQSTPQMMVSEQFSDVQKELKQVRQDIRVLDSRNQKRYQNLNQGQKIILSKVDQQFDTLMRMLTDEAKEGPRLFSFKPVDPGFFDRPKWISAKFQLTLWCEHSRLPLPELNPKNKKAGVYELNIPREWFIGAAPYIKFMTTTLGLVLPVAGSATKMMLEDAAYNSISEELDLAQKSIDFSTKGMNISIDWLGKSDAPDLEYGEYIRAEGSMLRQLHAFLKETDPSFGGLVRVQNKRQEFLWVHPDFVGEY